MNSSWNEALRRLFEPCGRALRNDHPTRSRLRHFQIGRGLLAGLYHVGALHAHAWILHGDAVDHRRDVAREIREIHPVDAISRPAIVNHRFPLHKARRR